MVHPGTQRTEVKLKERKFYVSLLSQSCILYILCFPVKSTQDAEHLRKILIPPVVRNLNLVSYVGCVDKDDSDIIENTN